MPRNKILSIGLMLVVLFGLIYFSRPQTTNKNPYIGKTFISRAYGISFSYPDDYFLEEKETGTPQRSRHSIVITKNTKGSRTTSKDKPENRGEQTSIAIDIYKNFENQNAETWVKGNSNSNYKLGSSEIQTITVSNIDALSYRWSGIYDGNSVVLRHRGNIVMMSVTFIEPSDEIVRVFESIIETLSLE